jgi:cytochrome c-type biogenesis protein CcmE
MNPVRKRRLWLVLAILAAAAAATGLVTMALQRNVAYLYTPGEVLRGDAGAQVVSGDAVFRLGGMVAAGSFQRAEGSMEARFRVTDGDAELPVRYTGILPDLFREKQAVVATGRMQDGVFVAEQVLAKHDETYVPKEVADKMGLAHQKHGVAAPAAGAKAANGAGYDGASDADDGGKTGTDGGN